jgi:hypothetical protein
MKFHTSCSQPLLVGDQYGSVQPWGVRTQRPRSKPRVLRWPGGSQRHVRHQRGPRWPDPTDIRHLRAHLSREQSVASDHQNPHLLLAIGQFRRAVRRPPSGRVRRQLRESVGSSVRDFSVQPMRCAWSRRHVDKFCITCRQPASVRPEWHTFSHILRRSAKLPICCEWPWRQALALRTSRYVPLWIS